ncbi:hypothetical protein ASF50_14950 [Nocardioides sp. Leaf307]|nr:hypothetical protein ASF50_14950 [Nocardioides sp. Leaf307]
MLGIVGSFGWSWPTSAQRIGPVLRSTWSAPWSIAATPALSSGATLRYLRRGLRELGDYGAFVNDEADEIERFTDQARWLFAYHESRGESLHTRAVALLGFVGVTLALLLGSNLPEGLDVTCLMKVLFALTVATLLLAGGCCLLTFKTRESKVPSVSQLRENWQDWVDDKRRGTAAKDVAEMLLRARELHEDSAVDWAMKTADFRARWFGYAVFSMGVSLASLSVLLVVVGHQLYF